MVALTGGIASGKTTVAKWIAQQGIDCIDADVIARQIVEPGQDALKAICQHFGKQVLTADGHLNRRQLRDYIFNHPEQRHWLENCLHPRIKNLIDEQLLRTSKTPYTLLIVPLLIESGFDKLADRILVVDIDPQQQLKRICQRDQVVMEQAEQIVASQSTRQERLAIADDVIYNDGSLAELKQKTMAVHRQYLQLAQAKFA
ncbi:dephospho-CoA kinase [Celerinatantimonas diazotrophica]|uniref:dephospho-CoA kinase n=1 Tax=Celerinatantimonas diazotrophica TaxID=412034 RepID=UPI0037BF902C